MTRTTATTDDFFQGPQPSKIKGILEFILELVKVIVICATIIILVRWFLFQPFYVKGSSMETNFEDGEYLIIYQLPYRLREQFHPFTSSDRGRAIIFHPPNDPKQFYIKRLIGVPGDRVKIENGHVAIYNERYPDGFVLEETYLDSTVETLGGTYSDETLGLDQIYVLGDNRSRSLDSRSIGPIPISNVIGEPLFRGWPLNRIGFLSKPMY